MSVYFGCISAVAKGKHIRAQALARSYILIQCRQWQHLGCQFAWILDHLHKFMRQVFTYCKYSNHNCKYSNQFYFTNYIVISENTCYGNIVSVRSENNLEHMITQQVSKVETQLLDRTEHVSESLFKAVPKLRV